ncbi:MAG: hypothetical protein WDN28_12815 [Chthoniobacter sp.]
MATIPCPWVTISLFAGLRAAEVEKLDWSGNRPQGEIHRSDRRKIQDGPPAPGPDLRESRGVASPVGEEKTALWLPWGFARGWTLPKSVRVSWHCRKTPCGIPTVPIDWLIAKTLREWRSKWATCAAMVFAHYRGIGAVEGSGGLLEIASDLRQADYYLSVLRPRERRLMLD